jgi:uncharacterized membrane protein
MPKKIFHKLLTIFKGTFWIVPGAIVCLGIVGAIGMIEIDRSGILDSNYLASNWLYNGGGTGARTLLGVVASSTIGVASTVFSITIAALSLAAGQMGPRLLRNFTQDRGNQVTLGIFLGTFSYALMVLRSVRTEGEGIFIPHLSLSIGILLAFGCVGTLVYFVGHMAGRINVDTVIDLVSEDVRLAIHRLTIEDTQTASSLPEGFWVNAKQINDTRRGYLQHLDHQHLADWAASKGTSIKLLVRPGDYVFPGAPIALAKPMVDGVRDAIVDTTGLGSEQSSSADLEFAIRQLVEVAVRALSPGINDPHTAISVLTRLGASLCDMVRRELANGIYRSQENVTLLVPAVDYDGLTDAMFHMIRQNAEGNTAVLIRMLDVLIAVASCEQRTDRRETLMRHAALVYDDSNRTIKNRFDLEDVQHRYQDFISIALIM